MASAQGLGENKSVRITLFLWGIVPEIFLFTPVFSDVKFVDFKKFYLLKCYVFACIKSRYPVRLEQLRERKL